MAAEILKNRWFIAIAAVVSAAIALTVAYNIESRRPVDFDKLPATAQEFITEYYAGETPVITIREFEDLTSSYEITFADGTKVKFDRNGEWKKIESRSRAVPQGLVPSGILDYTGHNFPGNRIMEISMDRRETEVKLDNRIELTFDPRTWTLRDFDD